MFGRAYKRSWDTRRNAALAADFFHASAAGGDCRRFLNLARIYLDRNDIDTALSWLSRALDTGFPDMFRAVLTLLEGIEEPRLLRVAERASKRRLRMD